MIFIVPRRIRAFHVIKGRQNIKRIVNTTAVYYHNIAVPVVHSESVQQIVVSTDIFAGRNTIFDIGCISFRPVRFRTAYKSRCILGQRIGIFCIILIPQKRRQPFVRSVHGTLVRRAFYKNGVTDRLYDRSRFFGFRKRYGSTQIRIAKGYIFTACRFITNFFVNGNRCASCFFEQFFQFSCSIFHGSCVMRAHRTLGHKNRILTCKFCIIGNGHVNRARIFLPIELYTCRNSGRTDFFCNKLAVFHANRFRIIRYVGKIRHVFLVFCIGNVGLNPANR